ncbi:AbiV family abortive infection protein [Xanthomonas vesicatoria]|uniref:AbiV family abortive infection protein n=1 Tax=Xanthomonas vesicatoria TaxID=56460 RepID=UPI001E52EE9D|nr:AbiV family abortive infection protein [Xanthomonas vesicatoria]MCC8619930.1 AbiV family abortive infection protein [Xanthomonas vesicatoria]MCC8629989.1 AbiV family abortive infection protein [Xanthomonas vesicatoria]
MSQKLDAYKGRLTAEQIAEGMSAAAENAARLVEDAEVLLDRGSFATAVSLAALAIEEAGKVSILRALAVARTDEEVRDCWKDYRSHTCKNAAWIFPQLFASGARQLESFRPMFAEKSDHTAILDNLKQLGFYTDCLGNAHWARPSNVIDAQLALQVVSTAKILSHPSKHSVREVALWVEHIGPVWKQDMTWMKQALLNWQDAMYREGLSTTTAEAMGEFVLGAQSGGV